MTDATETETPCECPVCDCGEACECEGCCAKKEE